MRKQYSDAFIEQALVKVYSRGEGRTIRDAAEDISGKLRVRSHKDT